VCETSKITQSTHTFLQSEIWKFVSGNACLRYVERSVGRDDAQLVVETVADVEGRQGEDVGALSAVVRTQDEQRITRVRRRVPVCTIVKNPRKVKIKSIQTKILRYAVISTCSLTPATAYFSSNFFITM